MEKEEIKQLIRARRNQEFIIIMDECEKKGWTLNRFLVNFIKMTQGDLEILKSTPSPVQEGNKK